MGLPRVVTEGMDANSGVPGLQTRRDTHCLAVLGFVVDFFNYKLSFSGKFQFSINYGLFKQHFLGDLNSWWWQEGLV